MYKAEDNPFTNIDSSEKFEDFCRDLISYQPNLINAKKLKSKGYNQYGGDIIANLRESKDSIVAQCKHYPKASFDKNKILKAIDLFLNSWDSFWKAKKVTYFYLIISQPKTSNGQFEEIQIQKEKLFEYGITLIDWWQDDLVREISKYPELVKNYLGEYWLQRFCPNEYSKLAFSSFSSFSDENSLANIGLDTCQTTLAEDLKKIIEPIREKVRCGKQSQAEKDFIDLKETHFKLVKPEAQAEILSFEIRLFFPHKRNLTQAKEILSQIRKTYSPFDTNFLDALITSNEFGFETGLEKISSVPNIQTLNLKLNFLLNSNRMVDFFQVYENEKNNFEYETETRRLYALYLAGLKNIGKAIEIIDEVANEKPDWEAVKISKAILYYLNGIPDEFIADYPLNLPIPLPLTLLKTDEDSNKKRQIAADLFQEILQSENLEDEQKLLFESWYLACLADNYNLQDDAIKFCEDSLAINPSHPYILIWALNRNYPIDYTESKKYLENKFSTRSIEPDSIVINQCIMFIALCLKERSITKARRHLLILKSLLTKEEQADLFIYWKCQIEIADGKEEKVFKQYALQLPNKKLVQDLQVITLQHLVNRDPKRKNRRLLLKFLKKLSDKPTNDRHLPLYAEICYQNKKFTEITKNTERLSRLVRNLNLAGILIEAHYRTNKFKACLELIGRFKFIYPNGELPINFQEYKVYSLLRNGQILEADEEAERIFHKEISVRNYLILLDAKKHSGDIYGIAQATSKIKHEINSIEPQTNLLIAQTIFSQNPELAKIIWREAKHQALQNTQFISDAISLGFQFGLDDELGELFLKVNDAKNQKILGIQLYNLEETLEIFNKQYEHQREIDNLYLKGQLPIHLLAEQMNLSLTEIFHHLSNLNNIEDIILKKSKILTRNGNRFSYNNKSFLETKKPILYLDISTLLLLEHLNLLEKLEVSATFYLSNKTFITLEAEIKNLADGQPSQTYQNLQIIKTADDNLFKTVNIEVRLSKLQREQFSKLLLGMTEIDLCTILQAEQQSAFVIFELPLHNFKTGEVFNAPSDFNNLRDYSSIVKSLHNNNLLTLEECQRCESAINQINEISEGVSLHTDLFLTELALKKFASLGVLKKVCQYFHVYLDKKIIDTLKIRVKRIKDREQLSEWVGKLKRKIESELNSKYLFISEDDLEPVQFDEHRTPRLSKDYRFQNVKDLLHLTKQDDSFAAIDDRYFSSFGTINNQIPIITIYEILEKLLFDNIISQTEYYHKLFQLRNENFRYLPITKEEVDFYFDLCDQNKLEKLGSLELIKLRQYLANCLLDGEYLQRPPLPLPPGQTSLLELEFITGTKRMFSEYICQVWKETSSLELAEIKANYIFFNFYISTFAIRHLLPVYVEHKNGLFHQSSDIAGLYLQGLSLLGIMNDKESIKIPQSYFNWINNLFLPRLEKDQDLLDETVKLLCNLILTTNSDSAVLERHKKLPLPEAEHLMKGVYKNLISLMPNVLQEKILQNEGIINCLGIEPHSSVSINSLSFNCKDFNSGISNSFQNVQTPIKLLDSNKSVIFSPIIKNDHRRFIEIKDDEKTLLTLSESEFGIYLPTREERFKFLSANKNIFDCDESLSSSESHRISSIEDPIERFFSLHQWSSNSVAFTYMKLEDQIINSGSFNWKQFLDIPIQGLLKHFRLDFENNDELNFPECLEIITKQLIEEEGLEIAFDRMVRFPHKLSESLFEAIKALPLEKQKEMIEKFRQSWRSPLSKFHYFTIVLRVLNGDKNSIEKAKDEVEFLFNTEIGKLEFEIFNAVLKSIYEVIISNKHSKNWLPSMQLVMTWTHSSKVFDLILLNQKDATKHTELLGYIKDFSYIPSYGLFDFDPVLYGDCLHPRFFEKCSFYSFASYSLLKDIPFDQIERINLNKHLEPVLFNQLDNFLYPQITLSKELDNRTNITSSALFSTESENYSWFESEKTIITIEPNAIQDYFFTFFEDLQKDYFDTQKWLYLNFFTEDFNLKEQYTQKFNSIVGSIDFEQVWETDSQLTQILLLFITKQKNILPDNLKEKARSWIKLLVWKLSEKYPYQPTQNITEEVDDWVFFISNVAVQLSIEFRNPLLSSQKYNDLIFELGQIWYYLPVRLENNFYNFWLNLPIEHNQNVGKNILLARSLK